MTMVVVTCRKHAHEVDCETYHGDEEELVRVHLGWVQQPLDGLEDDKDRDQNQEDAVCEP